MSTEATSDLLRRIQGAMGPDREIDGEVWKLLTEKPGDVWARAIGMTWHLQDPKDTIAYEPPPHLTGSIDAALGLVERVLPGWTDASDSSAPHLGHDWTLFPPTKGGDGITGTGPTRPLAILAALLLAQSTPAQADNPRMMENET